MAPKNHAVLVRFEAPEHARFADLARQLDVPLSVLGRQLILDALAAHESGERPATDLVRRGGEARLAAMDEIRAGQSAARIPDLARQAFRALDEARRSIRSAAPPSTSSPAGDGAPALHP